MNFIACSGCSTLIKINLRAMEVSAKGKTEMIFTYDGEDLLMWDCPICGYADSHMEYAD